MDFKQLQSFVTVVKYRSFTKAAEVLFTSQPTVSTHIRTLEEELSSRLIIRTTKTLEITPRGWELYECANNILELKNNLQKKWSDETRRIIHLGSSTIPSAYILPEILPDFGKEHPNVYFVINQSDSQGVIDGLRHGSFDVGLIGMNCSDEMLECVPFYEDRMVIITPINDYFLSLKNEPTFDLQTLLKQPLIYRENGSGTKKSADKLLESLGINEDELNITARINDQESIKNLVAGGIGISIISEKAAQDFQREKRLLVFELPENTAKRQLYLIYHKNYIFKDYMSSFLKFVKTYYQTYDK